MAMTNVKTRLSVMMFLQFFIWGAFFVPMGAYLNSIFSEYQASGELNKIVGGAYATQTWAALWAPLIVGFLADRIFNKEHVNGVLHLLGGGCLWWCSTITSPDQFFWVMLAFFTFYMPTMALVNAITFQNVSSVESDFPKIRLWGTIGWIVSGLVVAESLFGIMPLPLLPGIEDAGSTKFPLQLSAIVSVIYAVYCFVALPASPPQGKDEPFSIVKVLGLDALKLFKDRNYLVFAICSFLISIPLAFYYARTNDFVKAVSFGDDSAAVMALGQVSEIFFMLLVPVFLSRLGVKYMLLVGMIAWAVRYAIFGMFPTSGLMLVLGIVLHGVCYDFFFVTGQLYTDRVAPREMRTSAQAFVGLLTYGAGMLVGNYMHGAWGDYVGLDGTTKEGWLADAQSFWLMPAGFAVAISMLFFVTFWYKGEAAKPDDNATAGNPVN
jgi:nucleoside transporter